MVATLLRFTGAVEQAPDIGEWLDAHPVSRGQSRESINPLSVCEHCAMNGGPHEAIHHHRRCRFFPRRLVATASSPFGMGSHRERKGHSDLGERDRICGRGRARDDALA